MFISAAKTIQRKVIVHLAENAAKRRSDDERSGSHTVQSGNIRVSLSSRNDIGNHTRIETDGSGLRLDDNERSRKQTRDTAPKDE